MALPRRVLQQALNSHQRELQEPKIGKPQLLKREDDALLDLIAIPYNSGELSDEDLQKIISPKQPRTIRLSDKKNKTATRVSLLAQKIAAQMRNRQR